jgi:nitrite reductase/ring-hydroxylating ferredoxin subunit
METSTDTEPTGYQAFLREYPKTGPGTLAGRMLRHYWHPVCLSTDLVDLPYGVRMLGEDLVAYRAPDGSVGLVGAKCPHRGASLEYGQVREGGLQCSYHGWQFDRRGRCLQMPLEPEGSPLKDEIRHVWYPAEEFGGVIWCWMGEDKDNPPPLPKIDVLARDDGEHVVQRGDFRSYSYLNFMENFADIGHSYVLHLLEPMKVPEELKPYTDSSVNFDWRQSQYFAFETAFGMKNGVVHDTADPERKFVNTWSVGFPFYWRFGGISAGLPPDFNEDRRESGGMLRIIDDTHFEMFRYSLVRPGNFKGTFFPREHNLARGLAEGVTGLVEKKPHDFRRYPAWEGRPPLEDLVMQSTQGEIPDYAAEHLASSDAGVAILRRIYRRSMEAVAAGRKPKQVATSAEGVIEVDTFKGFLKPAEIRLGPENLPSSKNGAGLIRDAEGRLVF